MLANTGRMLVRQKIKTIPRRPGSIHRQIRNTVMTIYLIMISSQPIESHLLCEPIKQTMPDYTEFARLFIEEQTWATQTSYTPSTMEQHPLRMLLLMDKKTDKETAARICEGYQAELLQPRNPGFNKEKVSLANDRDYWVEARWSTEKRRYVYPDDESLPEAIIVNEKELQTKVPTEFSKPCILLTNRNRHLTGVDCSTPAYVACTIKGAHAIRLQNFRQTQEWIKEAATTWTTLAKLAGKTLTNPYPEATAEDECDKGEVTKTLATLMGLQTTQEDPDSSMIPEAATQMATDLIALRKWLTDTPTEVRKFNEHWCTCKEAPAQPSNGEEKGKQQDSNAEEQVTEEVTEPTIEAPKQMEPPPETTEPQEPQVDQSEGTEADNSENSGNGNDGSQDQQGVTEADNSENSENSNDESQSTEQSSEGETSENADSQKVQNTNDQEQGSSAQGGEQSGQNQQSGNDPSQNTETSEVAPPPVETTETSEVAPPPVGDHQGRWEVQIPKERPMKSKQKNLRPKSHELKQKNLR